MNKINICDYEAVVVGSGISGSILARFFAEECNKKVLVLEKRKNISGNMYDEEINGIFVQRFGPHIFHTNSEIVNDYIRKYAEWHDYKLECMVYMLNKYTPSPFNLQTVDDYFDQEKANEIKENIKITYPNQERATIVEMLNSENSIVKEYARFLFDADYKLYTSKQWGISPEEIDISVLNRVPVLFNYETGYFNDKYQLMPKYGFTNFVSNILNHENISIVLDYNAMDSIEVLEDKILFDDNKVEIPIIFTGAIDELLKYKFGQLEYRTLKFEYEELNIESYQEKAVVAYPEDEKITRITEFKKIYDKCNSEKTIIAKEYPYKFDKEDKNVEPYYPIINEKNKQSYEKYCKQLSNIKNLYLCGRLARYKYYNMDQAIEDALLLCEFLRNKNE